MKKLKQLASIIYRFFYPITKLDMYKKMGVKIGKDCKFQFDVVLDYSHFCHIKIGNNVTLAPRVHILAHDASMHSALGYTKIANVIIGNNVFIGASSIVLPGVIIGDNVIVGAGSIVNKNIEDNSVVVGNPIKKVSNYSEYIEKHKNLLSKGIKFEENDTLRQNVSKNRQHEMFKIVEKTGIAYIK